MAKPRCSFKIHAAAGSMPKQGAPQEHIFLVVAADNYDAALRVAQEILGEAEWGRRPVRWVESVVEFRAQVR